MEVAQQMNNISLDERKACEKLKKYEDQVPDYIHGRLLLWNKFKEDYLNKLSKLNPQPISIKLKDGKIIEGHSWKTTPLDVAKSLSNSLADVALVAKVDKELWDLERPLEKSCSLQILTFEDDEGKQVYWHSTAHILGEAMETKYCGLLCYGPPIENGFYYDMFMDKHCLVSQNDFPALENSMKSIIKDKQPFERLELSKEELMKMFEYNPFKLRILDSITSSITTVYRCGPLIDLCRGPHVRNTAKIKAFSLTKTSSTYWEGDCKAETLQRIYGISFPDTKQLKEWKTLQIEALKRDHRKIGKEQELFFFHELSPGSCFFFPKGAHIYNTLIEFIRGEYRKRGFSEVITPNMYNSKLWQISGHWQHYADNMFIIGDEASNAHSTAPSFNGDSNTIPDANQNLSSKEHIAFKELQSNKEVMALKPMNCPGHCLMFKHRPRSWRELPLRMADFGVLHRNEVSGALTGLTRVRRFQQDDAHIFCRMEQIEEEIKSCLQFISDVFCVFGFTFKLFLATRPEKFMGDPQKWDTAEQQLAKSLDEFGLPWTLNPGDGAFYGPKIDIILTDALKRKHQCATIQLDFQLPERFDLTYESGHINPCDPTHNTSNLVRPVIIHRAILGSLERMIAILTENYAGKWPFWLSPNQIAVLPVGVNFDSYALEVTKTLKQQGFIANAESDSSETLNKKIRNAQLELYNFILVVGEKELSNKTINVRTRDNKILGEMTMETFIQGIHKLVATKSSENEISP
ncbi:unnamed protein product [Gordionus sp. m RMFG-2023]|uniref:threonine--tRNA ligase 1, cytoplasmic-like isoform X2 n=1 Tax=Gordionus sp. m RMFG-2023 TaxID=3053472 RepID=UPI0030E2F8D6